MKINKECTKSVGASVSTNHRNQGFIECSDCNLSKMNRRIRFCKTWLQNEQMVQSVNRLILRVI